MAKQLDLRIETPSTQAEAAEVMRSLGAAGSSLRARGGGTKFDWGRPCEPSAVVSTSSMSGVTEHNAADMTAVIEAGTPLTKAQSVFAESGQIVALDPPYGPGDAATIGGVIASNDSGPLRHRYRAPRDMVLGMTVALSDGTLAHSGGRVIKNVAGYDIAKLFTGAFGTLGLIVEVVVRLYPLPARTVTVTGATDDPHTLQSGALAVSHASLEIERLDVSWSGSSGKVLAQFGGIVPESQAERAGSLLAGSGLEVSQTEDDQGLWAAQRNAQRAGQGEIGLKLSMLPGDLARVIEAVARLRGSLVGRAGLGLLWVRMPSDGDGSTVIARLRGELDGIAAHVVVLDAGEETRAATSVWGEMRAGELALMRSVKSRFDPAGVCAPGLLGAEL